MRALGPTAVAVRLGGATAAFVLLAPGCVAIGDTAADPPPATLEPAFPSVASPDPAGTRSSSPAAVRSTGSAAPSPTAATSTDAPPQGEEPTPPSSATPEPPRPPAERSVAPSDAPDDRTDRLGGSPPWSDLVAAEQRLLDGEVRLVVEFADRPPATSDDRTFNVAAFHDLDGDGRIDVEVWSNLGPDGWGTAVFDNRTGQARYAEDSEAVARDVDGRLVVTWPHELLDASPTWRWSLASEYGTPSELGTRAAARDDLPDDDRPVGMEPSA